MCIPDEHAFTAKMSISSARRNNNNWSVSMEMKTVVRAKTENNRARNTASRFDARETSIVIKRFTRSDRKTLTCFYTIDEY